MKYNSHLTGQSGASSNLIVQPTQCLGERTLRASKVQGRMAPEGLAKVTGLPCRCTRRRGRSQRQPPAGRGSGGGAPGTPKAGAGGDKGRSPSSPRRLRAHAAPPKSIFLMIFMILHLAKLHFQNRATLKNIVSVVLAASDREKPFRDLTNHCPRIPSRS